jgi:hypothetical protein
MQVKEEKVTKAIRTPNLERLKLWADELLTTTAEQGKGNLRLGDKYCCLGIAIEVAIANGCEVRVERFPDKVHTGQDNGEIYRYDETSDVLPVSVRDWYGVGPNPPVGIENNSGVAKCSDSDCHCHNGKICATDANDEKNWSFKQIGEGIIDLYGLGGDK